MLERKKGVEKFLSTVVGNRESPGWEPPSSAESPRMLDSPSQACLSYGSQFYSQKTELRLLAPHLQALLSNLPPGYIYSYETTLGPLDWPQDENLRLHDENVLLRRRLEEVEQRLSTVEARLPEEKIIILRSILKEEAKEEIRQLFSTGRTLYFSDIAEELRLDLETVVEICKELMAEGEIEVSDDPL